MGKKDKRKNGKLKRAQETSLPVLLRSAPEPEAKGATSKPRRGSVQRQTAETEVKVALDLDGTGRAQVNSGVPYFDHMLTALAKHSAIDLSVLAHGDVAVDPHHLVEDVSLCIGRALVEAVGERVGIRRFGEATLPFDEALIRCAIDLSGRPAFVYRVEVPPGRIGDFDVELCEVFFGALANEGRMNLHLLLEYGKNRHHIVEGCFKAFARALRVAVEKDSRRAEEVPSTKGSLD